MSLFRYAIVLLAVCLLFSCAGKGKAPAEYEEEYSPEKSFTRANELIDEKEFDQARALLLEVKNRDLSKKFAPLAQLRIADSYVKEEESELAVAEYKRFLELYPDHRHAAYAQYQIAMVYFNQIESPERGFGGAARALREFEILRERYPRNPYKEIIEIRIEKCWNIMADYEFLVGEFYRKKGSYNAAIGRYETLLKKYPDYKKEPLVLLQLGISYKEDGQEEMAKVYFNRLIEKYPQNPEASQAKKEISSLMPEKE